LTCMPPCLFILCDLVIYRKKREMIRKIAAAVLLMCMWTLSGCHTVHGVGQDIESGGRAIERSSGE
jgi:predicted small secreted protein